MNRNFPFIIQKTHCHIAFSDYHDLREAHIILLELILIFVVLSIMLASLNLTKIDCNRIANYLLVPVFLGLVYFNLSSYYRGTGAQGLEVGNQSGSHENRGDEGDKTAHTEHGFQLIDSPQAGTHYADSIELTTINGLMGLSVIHLVANLCGTRQKREGLQL